MWDTSFDESMLNNEHVIILCLTKEDASALCAVFAAHGIKWAGGEPLPDTTYFGRFDQTCYHVDCGLLRYGSRSDAESEYEDCIKCTFRGVADLQDVDIDGDAYNILMGV